MSESANLDQVRVWLDTLSHQTLGQFLTEKCKERGVSGRDLAEIIGMELLSVQRILNGDAKKVDAMALLRISEFLDVDMRVLLTALAATATGEEQKKLEKARKAGFLTEYFDLEKLKKIGFIQSVRDYDAIEARVLEFFGLSSLGEYANLNSLPLFSRLNAKRSDKMLAFWLGIVYARMKAVKNPNPFDTDRLEKVIPLFRAATLDVKNGFKSATRTLYECGVTVIVESYVTTTQIRGGTFISNGKPYIFLTKFPAYYDTLWFALLHELGHVLFDLDIIRKGSGSHLSGEDNLFEDPLLEKEANNFACSMLLPKDRLEYAKGIIHIPGFVEQASNEWNVHPSIVYGMHCYAHPDDFLKYSHHRLKADEALKYDYITWQKNTLEETTPEVTRQLTPVN